MPFFGRISDGDTDTFIPDGSIANKELTNCTVSYGGISLSLGGVCATPQFNLTNAENYNAGSLSVVIVLVVSQRGLVDQDQ